MTKICLDAGHYGYYNQSPANKTYYESKTMWKLHLLLKKHLETFGIKVITTKESEIANPSLYNRGAKSKGCDLFISLHSNAVGSGVNESIDYPVAYAAINGKADEIATLLTECVEKVMNTDQKARINKRKGSSGNDYYGVVRGATAVGTPGLILEHSFHTQTRATNWLLNDDNLNKLAKAEAAVIAEYFGIASGTEDTTPSGSETSNPSEFVINEEFVKAGQIHANNFTGAGLVIDGDFGPLSKKAAVMALQIGLNLDYNAGLVVDGILGPKTLAALKGKTVRKGDRGYFVTALEILLLLRGYNPNGVECPGTFGNGCAAAVEAYQEDNGLVVDKIAGYNTFTSLVS